MVNKVILIGNLGKDPEITYTPAGVAVCKATLATSEKWTSRDGERKEQTEWHNLVFWRKSAEIANEYLRKGSQVYVEGRIKYRSWDGQDGVKRYATDIEVANFQMLGRKSDSGGGGSSYQAKKESTGTQQNKADSDSKGVHYEPESGSGNFGKNDDSDLPF